MNKHEVAIRLEELEFLHRREGYTPSETAEREYPGFCVVCDQDWPCDVMVAVEMARKYEGLLT